MSFEIFPQSIRLFPQDQQRFALRNVPPPIIWTTASFATIQQDRRLAVSTSTGATGLLLPVLRSGIGGVMWTFISSMLPASGGRVEFRLAASGPSLRVLVEPTVTTVKDGGGSTVATITRNVVAGDVYYLEAASHTLRLYINGQEVATYNAAVATRYPIYGSVETIPPLASGSPLVEAPRVIGDWDVDPNSAATNVWTPAGGTLDDTTDTPVVTFFAGNNPGVYALTCRMAGSSYQDARATIIIDPLTLVGANAITLQPGQVVRLATNYDAAQVSLVTWSVVSGGGTLSGSQFTAPTAPGITVLRATAGNQQVDLRVTVPPVVYASITGAVVPSEVVTFTTNIAGGTINWTADIGTASGTGSSFVWTAPGQAGLEARIKVTNGTYTVTLLYPVLNKIPYDPNVPINGQYDRKALVSEAEDARRASVIKSRAKSESAELQFRSRDLTELFAMFAFWEAHYPGKRVIYEDKLIFSSGSSRRLVVYLDSGIAYQGDTGCSIDYSFRIREAS